MILDWFDFPMFSGLDSIIAYFRPQVLILSQVLSTYLLSEVYRSASRSKHQDNMSCFVCFQSVHEGTCVCTHVCTHMYTYTCVYVHVCVCVCVHVCITYMYMYTYMCVYTHVHVHTCTLRDVHGHQLSDRGYSWTRDNNLH